MTDELSIARKAREAATEAEELRAENRRLAEMLDALRSNTPGALPKVRTGEDRKCPGRCESLWVDARDRAVTCQVCGATVDPFDALLGFAERERQFMFDNAAAIAAHRRLSAEVEELRRECGVLRTERVACPRGCGKLVAVAPLRPGGVVSHGCYSERAKRGDVPRTSDQRWRVVTTDGKSRWCDLMTATRTATKHTGATVEEYKGPIGDKAERFAEREAEARRRFEHRQKGKRT